MSTPQERKAPGRQETVVLRLYIAREGANSLLARQNLEALCARNDHHRYQVEIVDVTADPQVALARGIFVSPALEILSPAPGAMIYGNLNDRAALKPFFPNLEDGP
jgi:circadian clock protein KaiB